MIKGPDGQLRTDLYRKPSVSNTLLHASIAHPCPLVHSILYAQYLRLRRNCTEDEDFHTQVSAFAERLLAKGYSRTNLRKAYNKAFAHTRSSL